MKIVSLHKKALCIVWIIEIESDIQTEKNFWTRFGSEPPDGTVSVSDIRGFILRHRKYSGKKETLIKTELFWQRPKNKFDRHPVNARLITTNVHSVSEHFQSYKHSGTTLWYSSTCCFPSKLCVEITHNSSRCRKLPFVHSRLSAMINHQTEN